MIIGLYAPKAQSGKTTIANYLINNFNFEHVKFAMPIYHMWRTLGEYAKLNSEEIENYLDQSKEFHNTTIGLSFRKFAETVGMKLRDVNPDIWVQLCYRHIKHIRQYRNIVIDDLRLCNEYVMLCSLNAKLIYIERLNHPRQDRYPSEGHLDNDYEFDYRIYASSLDELQEKAAEIMFQLRPEML